MKSIYFLVRAYNDFDCRLPLLLEFARDANYSVTIIAIPTNIGLQDPKSYELHEFAVKNGVTINTIYDFVDTGLLLLSVLRLYTWIARWKAMEKFSPKLHFHFTSIIFRIVRQLSSINRWFIPKAFEKFKSSIVIVDEIIFHRGRSFFIDELYFSWKKQRTFELYAFLTGQDPYIDLWEDDIWGNKPVYVRESIGVPLFVPGPNDARVMKSHLPQENIVVTGNTRFDKSWVTLQSKLSKKNTERISWRVGAKVNEVKIVFMLSKIEYGVKLVNLIETMNKCASLNNTIVIMKPHTRGMNLKDLGYALNDDIVDGSDHSSSDLIEWADFVLFTGSSIVFHALILKKKVCYLRYCQRYKSIYDTGESFMVANNINELLKYIGSPDSFSYCETKALLFFATHVYNGNMSGQVCQDIKFRIEYLSNSVKNIQASN